MIKRLENGNLNGTSFHGHYFMATKEDVEKVCGKVMYTDNEINEKTENRFGSKKAYEALHRAFHLHPKINYNI